MGNNHNCGERNKFASHLQYDHSNYSSHKYRLSALESHLYPYLHKCSSNSTMTQSDCWDMMPTAWSTTHTPLVCSFGSGASLIKRKQNTHFHNYVVYFSWEMFTAVAALNTGTTGMHILKVVSNAVAHAVKEFRKKQPIFVGCFSGCLFQRVSASALGNCMATNVYCVY